MTHLGFATGQTVQDISAYSVQAVHKIECQGASFCRNSLGHDHAFCSSFDQACQVVDGMAIITGLPNALRQSTKAEGFHTGFP